MMLLQSKTLTIKTINKKTKAKFFEDVSVGDLLQVSMELRHTGSASGGGTYASYLTIKNLSNGTSTINSQSQLVNNLKNFEIEESH
jgi:hypothetical protein